MIKKIILLNSELPPINAQSDSYALRYRIVSEDKNRFSSWSPIFNLPFTFQNLPSASAITSSINNGILSFTWPKYSDSCEYDIWAKWNVFDWKYFGSTIAISYSISIDSPHTNGYIEIYKKTNTIQRNPKYLIAQGTF